MPVVRPTLPYVPPKPESPPPTTPRRRPRFRRWIAGGVGVLLVIVLGGAGYLWYSYQNVTSHISYIGSLGATAYHVDENILLVGDDHRPAGASAKLLAELGTTQDGGGTNTDTMMVLHIPANGAKATLISFPRDSWVAIPGFGHNKLNAAFTLGTAHGGGDTGGARLLTTVIQNMTGLAIDHFVRVSMVGFYQIADVLGPIQVCLKQATNDPYSGTNLPAGVSTLNAKQALAFVRQRHGLAGGDLDREVRQQYFLSTELRKALSLNVLADPVKLQKLLSAVGSSLQTDPGLNLLSLAAQMHNLTAGNLTAATIPIVGVGNVRTNAGDLSVVNVDFGAIPAFIAGITGKQTAYSKATTISPSGVTVTVLNGRKVTGAAGVASGELARLGFTMGAAGSAPTTARTTIEYPPGSEAAAKTVALYVPGATPVSSTTVSAITLVLGTDGLSVKAAPTPSAQATTAPSAAAPAAQPRTYSSTTCIN